MRFLFAEPLPQSGVYSSYGFGTCAGVLATMLAVCAAHVCIAKDTRQALRLWGCLWGCNLVYLLMILLSYFIGFEIEEVLRLAEADRYTMLVALWTGVTACALIAGEGETPRPRARMALIAVMAAALLPLSHPEMTFKTFVTREYIENTVWARDITARSAQLIRSQMAGETDGKLLCIGDCEYIKLHYELAGEIDIGTFDQSWEKAEWSSGGEAVLSAAERMGITHVFVGALVHEDYPELSIDERFDGMTADGEPLCAYSLYRAETGEDGSVHLRLLAQMPEQENEE